MVHPYSMMWYRISGSGGLSMEMEPLFHLFTPFVHLAHVGSKTPKMGLYMLIQSVV